LLFVVWGNKELPIEKLHRSSNLDDAVTIDVVGAGKQGIVMSWLN
jgi:hypothetical protein